MPFGLRNAAQTFQRFMNNNVLQNLEYAEGDQDRVEPFHFCYLDDVIIASDDEKSHKRHLKLILERFNKFGITINLGKCTFGASEIEFLGYKVSAEGIKPLEEKIQAIVNYPKPETVEQLRRFLGMINFYRAHLPHAVDYQKELNKYLHNSKKRDKTKINWTEVSEKAFVKCKECLQNSVMLSHPASNVPLALMTDASNSCVGAVLQQEIGDQWKPLGYFSKQLSETQQKYSTYDRELLAIYLAIQYFRKMFEGKKLVIYTDHKPLTFAFSRKVSEKETPRRTRQLAYISEFTTDIRHVTGDKNIVADALSRVETIDCPTIRRFS
ncbi:hypothetical protein PYW08_002963 [Mythimna loreyi]|uniref:Uncharacterized protein n=1 Tax=Mythimna loreyi TaxID=667449 RepID=A0ACC2QQ84_9NEOP|nr:hypothetical protein PYW08_002963 [Mythimna loreyi]